MKVIFLDFFKGTVTMAVIQYQCIITCCRFTKSLLISIDPQASSRHDAAIKLDGLDYPRRCRRRRWL